MYLRGLKVIECPVMCNFLVEWRVDDAWVENYVRRYGTVGKNDSEKPML